MTPSTTSSLSYPFVLLSERSDRTPPPAGAYDTERLVQTGALMGWRNVDIPAHFRDGLTAEDALGLLQRQAAPTPGLLNGFIPTLDRYRAIYAACQARNIHLLNTPDQTQRALELDRSAPLLGELTAQTVTLTAPDQLDAALDVLGLPIFFKGAVKSYKQLGWQACTAHTREEAHARIAWIFERGAWRTQGRVMLRQLLDLKHTRTTPTGFPAGREFRVFLWHDTPLAWGYYWDGHDPDADLSDAEQRDVLAVAAEAARRLQVPYTCIDVGQDTSGRWWVIEPGDGQFAGFSGANMLQLTQNLQRSVEATPPPWADAAPNADINA